MEANLDYKQYPILFIDDEPAVLKTISSLLEQNFTVDTTDDPYSALDMVQEKEYAVVLSDQKMPKMPGFELLSRVKDVSPLTIRVLITGFTDIDAAIEAVNKGEIFRYIPKKTPIEDREMLLKQAIQWYHVHREMIRLQTLVRSYEANDILELKPDESKEREDWSNFIPDYNENCFMLSRKYYKDLESIVQKNQGKLEGVSVRHVLAGQYGSKAHARAELKKYLSDEEMTEMIWNRELTMGAIHHILKEKISNETERSGIALAQASWKANLHQMVFLRHNKAAIVKEQLDGLYYTARDLSPGEKVILHTSQPMDGKRIECRAGDGQIIEAFDEDGGRLGVPKDFFEKIIAELKT